MKGHIENEMERILRNNKKRLFFEGKVLNSGIALDLNTGPYYCCSFFI